MSLSNIFTPNALTDNGGKTAMAIATPGRITLNFGFMYEYAPASPAKSPTIRYASEGSALLKISMFTLLYGTKIEINNVTINTNADVINKIHSDLTITRLSPIAIPSPKLKNGANSGLTSIPPIIIVEFPIINPTVTITVADKSIT